MGSHIRFFSDLACIYLPLIVAIGVLYTSTARPRNRCDEKKRTTGRSHSLNSPDSRFPRPADPELQVPFPRTPSSNGPYPLGSLYHKYPTPVATILTLTNIISGARSIHEKPAGESMPHYEISHNPRPSKRPLTTH